jgi:hypothetical protein
MSCCGQKREQIRQQRTVYVQPAPAPDASIPDLTSVVFMGFGSYLVTGPYSGDVYRFSQAAPEQRIDSRDAEALLGTRFFRKKI